MNVSFVADGLFVESINFAVGFHYTVAMQVHLTMYVISLLGKDGYG